MTHAEKFEQQVQWQQERMTELLKDLGKELGAVMVQRNVPLQDDWDDALMAANTHLDSALLQLDRAVRALRDD